MKAGTERTFEEAWTELEELHDWRISEVEIHNPPIALSTIPFAWQDHDSRRAAAFREKYRLAELVAGADDDWEAILRLRHWAYNHIHMGTPSFPTDDPVAAVEASLEGATFWCTYYAYAFVAAASSMGYPARHLGIDNEHSADERSSHHGIADVWVNRFRKWVALDVTFDAHYELDGVPLNAEEMGRRWQTHKGEGIKTLLGPGRREVERARFGEIEVSESWRYFWHYIDTLNDVFHRRGTTWPKPVVFLVDDARKAQTWYQGAPPNTRPHGRYENGTFVTTERYADAYPDMNCTRLAIGGPKGMPYYCRVRFGSTCVPSFSHYEARTDGGEPERIDGAEHPWQLHPGECSLEVRAVNAAGVKGPPSRARVEVAEC